MTESPDEGTVLENAKEVLYRITDLQVKTLLGLLGEDYVTVEKEDIERRSKEEIVRLGGAIRNLRFFLSRKGNSYMVDRGLLIISIILVLRELVERIEKIESKLESLEKELKH